MRLYDLMPRPQRGATRYKGERVPVNLRVPPAIRDRLRMISKATGMSYADYLEELIRRDEVSDGGVPAWHPTAQSEPAQQKLDMTA
jgi:hypothetical protein